MASLDGDALKLYWSLVTVGGAPSASMRVALAGAGWLSWGLSEAGEMSGNIAVVGQPGTGEYTHTGVHCRHRPCVPMHFQV